MNEVKKSDTNSKTFALRAAQWIGCSGAHKNDDGKWMPCGTHAELIRLSRAAEPRKKTAISDLQDNIKKRNKKGRKKSWENLRETTPLGLDTLTTGGIVSARINSIKGIIPGVSPRDNDDDVYTDIESARKRSVRLGCIGVRRLQSQSGRRIWMPCTNNTDYARLAGTTALGRRHQREATSRSVRTIVRQELNRRKKSLFEEIHDTKGIAGRIGGAISSPSRRAVRRAMSKITGELDPKKRRDIDNDGLIFDGTWREMPAPSKPQGLQSGKTGPLDTDAQTNRRRPANVKLSEISKGGPIKARNLLEMGTIKNLTREQKARRLGVSVEVIDAMYQPDASIDVYAADRLAVNAMEMNPSNIWPLFYDIDVTPERSSRMMPISKRTQEIMELRAQGMTFTEIGNQFGISKQGAQSAYNNGVKRNSLVPKPSKNIGTSSQSNPSRQGLARGDGMIQRDERGIPIPQRDVRKENMDSIVENLKKLGMSESEINILLTGNSEDKPAGLRSSSTFGVRSRTPNKDNPDSWSQDSKKTMVNWARSKPTFNVPYQLAMKHEKNGDLTPREWKLLKQFFDKYANQNQGTRSMSSTLNVSNIGGKRVGQIILNRVNPESIKPDGEKTHYFIVGAPGMGKTTLTEFLSKRGLIPTETEAAHVDPDFVKQALEGYNAGTGAIAVHRESTRASTHIVNDARSKGLDIVTQGTGTRLPEYNTTGDPRYQTVIHAAYLDPRKAQQRLDAREKIDGRKIAGHILPHIAAISYNMMTDYLKKNQIGSFFLWDTDVPFGTAPKLIAKVEKGVFVVNDEEKFKSWSTGGGSGSSGAKNLEYYKRKWK